MIDNDLLKIASRLLFFRDIIGKTQEQVASESGISRSNIVRFEKGINFPSLQYVSFLTISYKLNFTWLITGEETPILEVSNTEDDWEKPFIKKYPGLAHGSTVDKDIKNMLEVMSDFDLIRHRLLAKFVETMAEEDEQNSINKDYIKRMKNEAI